MIRRSSTWCRWSLLEVFASTTSKTRKLAFHKANPVQRRAIMQASPPYIGPATYETLRKRFMASEPDPESFYSRKRQEEARKKGEYVDIHDVTGIQSSQYDVLISDIKHETLKTTIAQDLGIEYLSKAEGKDARCVLESASGYIRQLGYRAVVPLVVNHHGEARWVFFVVDNGSPWTYLSTQACETLGIQESASVTIGGHRQISHISPANSHFSDINLLGGDFFTLHEVYVWYDYVTKRVKLHFGGKREVTPMKG